MIEMIRKFENNRETIADHRNVLLPNFFFPLFWETKRDQQPELFSFSQHVSTRSKMLVLEHVETTNEKKKGRKNLLKQRISSPPRIFPRARFEKRRIHSTRNRFVQTLLLHPVKSWRESCSVNERGTVLRTWGWDQPGWETSSKKNGSKGEEGVWSEERGGVKCVKLRVNRDHFGDGWTFAWIISPMMKVFAEKERRDLVFLCKRGEGEFAACNWKEKIIGSIRKMCEFGLDLKRILGDKVSSS